MNSISTEALDELRLRLAGGVHRPGDAAYEDACTLFNSMIERRPALVASCTVVDDVIAALAFARDHGLEVSVRSGGHSVAGLCLCDGGLVLDVRPMNDIEVDPVRRVARVGGGATWSQLDRATQRHGLATTGGRVSTTGVSGFTLGGGSGWLERKHGLACDNVVGAELVTADGRLVRASAEENPDLFWALRGGGGNFGVVTALELELHRVGPEVYGGMAIYPIDRATDVLRAWRDLMDGAPEELSLAVLLMRGPDEEDFPAALRGELVLILAGMHCGEIEDGKRVVGPLLEATEPFAEMFGPVPYAELQCALDDPPGQRNYWAVEHLSEFPDEVIEQIHSAAVEMPGSAPQLLLATWGGAVQRRGVGSAVGGRGAKWVVHPLMLWDDPADDDRVISWSREFRATLAPHTTGATYANFAAAEEAEARSRSTYSDTDFDRMARIKSQWDPEDVFHASGHVPPLTPAEPVA